MEGGNVKRHEPYFVADELVGQEGLGEGFAIQGVEVGVVETDS